MRHHIRNTFVTPFTDPKRIQIYLATALGVLGFDLALLTFSYHMAQLGSFALALFWLTFFALTGFIFMPGLCWIYGRYGAPKAAVIFLSFLSLGFGLAWNVGHSAPLGLALAYGLISMPFWTAYHLSMFTHSSSDNRGNEVAIAYVTMGIGGGLGYMASGLILQKGYVSLALVLAFLTLGMGTFMLLRLLKSRRPPLGKYWHEFSANIKNTDPLLRTMALSSGMIEVLNSFLLPAWLSFEGIQPRAAGSILALQIFVRILISPVVGKMAQQMHGRELSVGLSLYTAGWIVLSLPLGIPLLAKVILALFIWVGASQLFGCGLDKRWYEYDHLMSVGTREMFLNIGRLVISPIGLGTMHLSPRAFPLVAALLVILVGIWLLRALRQSKRMLIH